MTHSPTPWKTDAMGNIWSNGPNATKIAEFSVMPDQAKGYHEKSKAEHSANAQLICNAVNAYDQNQETIKELVAVVEAAIDFHTEGKEGMILPDYEDRLVRKLVSAFIKADPERAAAKAQQAKPEQAAMGDK